MTRARGVYVTPRDFVAFAEPRPGVAEIATRTRATGWSFGAMGLPNPDPILRQARIAGATYRDLQSDAHVGGCIRRRKAAVRALQAQIDRTDGVPQRTVKRVSAMLAGLPLDRIVSEILDAPLFGYQPMEVRWAYVEGEFRPVDVVGKPPDWFCFDTDNRLRFRALDAGPLGEPVAPCQFLLPRQDATYDNPYGVAELSRCFWPTQFKRNGYSFWLTFIEKYGQPWLIGKQPRTTPYDETMDFMAKLDAMVKDAVGVIPDDASVEMHTEAASAGSTDNFERFLMFCRSEVSIALLGQNQNTEKEANRASATAGHEVTRDIRDSDAALVMETINTLIGWYLSFNTSDPAPRWTLVDPEELSEQRARRDVYLRQAGATLTPAYFRQTYGLSQGDVSDATAAPAAADFAENADEEDVLDAALAGDPSQAPAAQQAAVERWLAPLMQARAHGGETAMLEALAERYPQLDDHALIERLTQVLFVAELWGAAHGVPRVP